MSDIYGTPGNDLATVTSGTNGSNTAYTFVDLGEGIDRLTIDYSLMLDPFTLSANSLYVHVPGVYTLNYYGVEKLSVLGGKAGDSITTGAGADTVASGAGNDIVYAGDGDDVLKGGTGDDYLNSGSGKDTVDGGLGTDRWAADYSGLTTAVNIDMNAVQGVVQNTGSGTVTNIEALSLKTGSGNDSIILESSGVYSNDLNTGDGADTVKFSVGSAVTIPAVNNVDMGLGDDHLIIDYSQMLSGIQLSGNYNYLLAGGSYSYFYGVERYTVLGGVVSDSLTTSDGNDSIDGRSGDDALYAGLGNDVLAGGDGNDYLNSGSGVDTVDGGVGEDRWAADLSAVTSALNVDMNAVQGTVFDIGSGSISNVESLSLQTGSGDDSIVLESSGAFSNDLNTGDGDDAVTFSVSAAVTTPGVNNVDMGPGDDHLIVDYSQMLAGFQLSGNYNYLLAGGNYSYFYGVERFTVQGGSGSDSLTTSDGNDSLDGGTGDDTFYAGAGNDVLFGDEGNDYLHSGTGLDTVDGGLGVDSWAADYSGVTTAITLDMNAVQGVFFDTGQARVTNIELLSLWSGSGDDQIVMDSSGIYGGDLHTGEGDDTVKVSVSAEVTTPAVFNLDMGVGDDDHFSVDYSKMTEGFQLGSYYLQVGGAYSYYYNVDRYTVLAGVGNDSISTGSGNDSVSGGAGADTLTTFEGNDSLDGDSGDDALYAGAGNDLLSGGEGNDYLDSGSGLDTVDGGAGMDRWVADFSAATTAITIDENVEPGSVAVNGVVNVSNIESLKLWTGSGDDVISTVPDAAFNNELYLGDGADQLTVSVGASGVNTTYNAVDMGAGDDYLVVDYSQLLTGFWYSHGYYLSADGINSYYYGADRYKMLGGQGNDYIATYEANDSISGGTGDDTVYAAGGNDTLSGGDGNDYLDAGSGDDWIDAGAGDDNLNGGVGNDWLSGGDGNDYLNSGVGNLNDTVDGGAGIDRWVADFSAATTAMTVNENLAPGVVKVTGMGSVTNVEALTLWTGSGNDVVTTNVDGAFDNNLYTGEGADRLTVSIGASGVNKAYNYVDMGLGDDYLIVDYSQLLTGFWYSHDYYLSADGINSYYYGVDRYKMLGGQGNDYIATYEGNDSISGGAGHDTIYAGGGIDTLSGGDGNDLLDGGTGNDRIDAGAGDDNLYGGAGNDSMSGGDGNDYLHSGIGNLNDTVDGGAGIDRWVADFSAATTAMTVNENLAPGVVKVTGMGSVTNVEAVTLWTGSGNDVVTTNVDGAFNNELYLGDGADRLTVSIGASGVNKAYNYVDMGLGDDYLIVDYSQLLTGFWYSHDYYLSADGINSYYYGVDRYKMLGGQGDDYIATYEGNDSITGGTGNDTVYASGGNDTLSGGDGNDLLDGGTGNDRIDAGAGDDNLYGGVGNDWLSGGDGNDYLYAGTGNDTVDGGAGVDRWIGDLSAATTAITVNENVAPGVVQVTGLPNVINVEALTLTTGSGDDVIITQAAGAFDNSLQTGDGADTLTVSVGASGVNKAYNYVDMGSGPGEDLLIVNYGLLQSGFWMSHNAYLTADGINSYYYGADRYKVTGGKGNDYVATSEANDTLTGGAGNDGLYSAGGNDLLDGGIGNDLLDAGEGNDALTGGLGTDSMYGGNGNDTYYVNATVDVTIESTDTVNGGVDTVISTVNRTLGADFENLTLSGTAAINGSGNTLANVLQGNSAANLLQGFGGNDSLSGAAGDDSLNGGVGDDTLNGGLGMDSMSGGTGNDIYYIDDAGDVVAEASIGGGVDTLISSVTRSLGDFQEKLTLSGSLAIDGMGNALANVLVGNSAANLLQGDAGNDSLTGNAGDDSLDGGLGADVMAGGLGNDTYWVDLAADVVNESSDSVGGGVDTIISSVTRTLGLYLENLNLSGTDAISGTGNTLANVLLGNEAANLLKGGSGNDTLSGGGGNDSLSGGADADCFLFDTALAAGNVDTVTDFVVGTDHLALDDSIFTALGISGTPEGVGLSAALFHLGAAATDADQRLIYNKPTGALYYDADGSGVEAAVQVAIIGTATHPLLSAADFLVVS